MTARGRSGFLSVVVVSMLGVGREVAAHDFRPGVLALSETALGRFDMVWTAPVDSRGEPAGVSVVFPRHCRREGAGLDCGSTGLHGAIGFTGMHARRMHVAVAIRWRDGAVSESLVSGDSASLVLGGPRADRSAITTWLWLGVEHVAGGKDHIAFVVGLVLLVGVGRVRRLLATVTAFTIAHSLTLALAALGSVRLPRAPVEACIALSVLLVAREVLCVAPTLSRRAPWVVALLFGLVHGLGFADALTELGLPRLSLGRALVGFNLGIELGQLVIVALALIGATAAAGTGVAGPLAFGRLRLGASYLLGSLAAFWLIARTAVIINGV